MNSLALELNLSEKGQQQRTKLLDKLFRAEIRLEAVMKQHQELPSYNKKRADYSVHSFQARLDALNLEMEEALERVRKQFEDRRKNLEARLAESTRRLEEEKNAKPRGALQYEREIQVILEELVTYNLATTSEKNRLRELRGEEPLAQKEEELSPDVKEYLAERGTMPANREELQLFKERKAILADVAREKREREQKEEEKREEAKRQYQLQKDLDAQKEKELQEEKLKEEKAAAAKELEDGLVEFEGRKVTKFEKQQMLKARKKEEEAKKVKFQEQPSDTEDEEDDSSDMDEEEYRQLVAAQKAELRRKHEERIKKLSYTPPSPEVQDTPRIISNTKAKKPIKFVKR